LCFSLELYNLDVANYQKKPSSNSLVCHNFHHHCYYGHCSVHYCNYNSSSGHFASHHHVESVYFDDKYQVCGWMRGQDNLSASSVHYFDHDHEEQPCARRPKALLHLLRLY
jgi:hypothetical protein